VTKVKWVSPSGQLAEASEKNDPAQLYLMRSSYGLYGVIYEVTFRIKALKVIQFNSVVSG
jgi:hypothetical protein